jgi:hypothetical protein
MMFPLSATIEFGAGAELAIALVCGLGFGFALERAGFGSARKLTAVFYLYDMAVVKVMFTAIVTAMTGLFVLSAVGVMDLAQLYVEPTNYLAQIGGGLVFGAGFMIGGYCPGTSMAALATGRIDALLYALGIFAGTLVYAEVYPAIKDLVNADPMGQVTLPEVLGLPWGLVAFAVVVIAVVGFWGATKIERWIGSRP